MAQTLGLEDLLDRKPAALSGGQRQRVAMGRAIVREPKAFLMDEPLSNLDAKLRVSMRAELAKLHERLGVTTVYVTHDQVEAMTLGQRVAVLRDGTLQQFDTPHNLFHRPGEPVRRRIHRLPVDEPRRRPRSRRLGPVRATSSWHCRRRLRSRGLEREVILGIRPTCFDHASAATPTARGCGSGRRRRGPRRRVPRDLHRRRAPRQRRRGARGGRLSADDEGKLFAHDRAVFTVVVDTRQTFASGTEVELAVDHRRLHFFDPETGLALDGAGPAAVSA